MGAGITTVSVKACDEDEAVRSWEPDPGLDGQAHHRRRKAIDDAGCWGKARKLPIVDPEDLGALARPRIVQGLRKDGQAGWAAAKQVHPVGRRDEGDQVAGGASGIQLQACIFECHAPPSVERSPGSSEDGLEGPVGGELLRQDELLWLLRGDLKAAGCLGSHESPRIQRLTAGVEDDGLQELFGGTKHLKGGTERGVDAGREMLGVRKRQGNGEGSGQREVGLFIGRFELQRRLALAPHRKKEALVSGVFDRHDVGVAAVDRVGRLCAGVGGNLQADDQLAADRQWAVIEPDPVDEPGIACGEIGRVGAAGPGPQRQDRQNSDPDPDPHFLSFLIALSFSAKIRSVPRLLGW